ncbi:MAG: TraR/DksA family transcriptional regulator [Planctomycetota bacterium]
MAKKDKTSKNKKTSVHKAGPHTRSGTVKKSAAVKKSALFGKSSTPQKIKKVRQTRKSTLSRADIEHFTQLLLAKRAEIVGDVNSMENDALKKSRLDAAGDLSSMPIHMADIGTDNYEQEFALELLDSERKILREINYALQRIAERRYGICEGTGEPIPKARLEANPWARYSVEYARLIEQGLAEETDAGEAEDSHQLRQLDIQDYQEEDPEQEQDDNQEPEAEENIDIEQDKDLDEEIIEDFNSGS